MKDVQEELLQVVPTRIAVDVESAPSKLRPSAGTCVRIGVEIGQFVRDMALKTGAVQCGLYAHLHIHRTQAVLDEGSIHA